MKQQGVIWMRCCTICVLLVAGFASSVVAAPQLGFGSPTDFYAQTHIASLVTADVNDDGKLDLIAVEPTNGFVATLLGDGAGVFFSPIYDGYNKYAASIAVGFLNRDIDLDLVVGTRTATLKVHFGDHTGNFPMGGPALAVDGGYDVAIADMNNDGSMDIVGVNKRGNSISLFLGDGTGIFTSPVTFATGIGPAALAVADLNHDGKLDVVVQNSGDGSVPVADNSMSILLGDGVGGFGAATRFLLSSRSEPFGGSDISLADFNGDGNMDVVALEHRSNGVAYVTNGVMVLLGDGTGSFSQPVYHVAGTAPNSIVVHDFNGDGYSDVATSGGGMVNLLPGDGQGGFGAVASFSTGATNIAATNHLAAGDFNGDGRPDIAVTSYTSAFISVLLNQTVGFGANLVVKPKAVEDRAVTPFATAVTIGNILSNDVDAAGSGSLRVAAVDSVSMGGGVVTDNGNGTFTYTPSGAFSGKDRFAYTIVDGNGSRAQGKVTITVEKNGAQPAWRRLGAADGGGGVYSLLFDPVTAGTLYAATSGGIFKSTDGGIHWIGVNSPPANLSDTPTPLAIDPGNASLWYAATSQGLFKTADSGASWIAINQGLPTANRNIHPRYNPARAVLSVTIDPKSSSTLYAGSGQGLFKSIDGGATWKKVNGAPNSVNKITFDPNKATMLYADTGNGLYKSTDDGATWVGISASQGRDSLEVDPVSSTLYVFNGSGIFTSQDGGATWVQPLGGLGRNSIADFVIDFKNSGVRYAIAFDGKVYKSSDSGRNWSAQSAGLLANGGALLVADPNSTSILFAAGIQNGLYRSADGGASWTAVIGIVADSVQALAVASSAPSTIYVGGSAGGIHQSTDGGTTWVAKNRGLGTGRPIIITALAVDPSNPVIVFAGQMTDRVTVDQFGNVTIFQEQGVMKSVDGGASWVDTGLRSETDYGFAAIRINPQDSRQIFVVRRILKSKGCWVNSNPKLVMVCASGVIDRSLDGGATWTRVYVGNVNTVGTVEFDPVNAAVIYSSGAGGVMKSSDGGTTWTALNFSITTAYPLFFDPASPAVLHAGSYQSSDGGGSWVSAFGTSFSGATIDGFTVDPANASRFLVASGSGGGEFGGVRISEDGGKNWSTLASGVVSTSGIAANMVNNVAFAGSTLLAGTAQGLYKLAGVVNLPPRPSASSVTIVEDGYGTSRVIPNEGGSVTYTIAVQPIHGNATIDRYGVTTYTPVPNYNGNDVFAVTVIDSNGTSGAVAVRVRVTAVNDPPAPTAQGIGVRTGVAATRRIDPGDPDARDSHTFAITTPPLHGTATVDSYGTIAYSPAAAFTGQDGLTVTVTDAAGTSGTVAVPIRVLAAGAVVLDVDGNGVSDANDGVMILRRLNGAGTVTTGIALPQGTSNTSVVAAIAQAGAGFDVDGNGISDANDGVMILRRLNGAGTITTGVVLPKNVGGGGAGGERTNGELTGAIDGLR